MQAAMYLRKSRAEENESVEETLARHKDTLTTFAAQNGIAVTEVYEEVVSGDSLFSRPAMLKLLEELDKFNAVLCMDIDRLGRGTMREQGIVLESLKRANCKIITPRKIYDLNDDMDETMTEFQAFFARQELKMIKNRLQRGLKKSASEGYHMGPPPYGYKSVTLDKKPALEIIPEQADVVRLIFSLYNSGYGVTRIAHHLNAMGATPQRIPYWRPVSIRRILRNEIYAGRVVYGKLRKSRKPGQQREEAPQTDRIVADGQHAAIIDRDLFDAVQTQLIQKTSAPVNIDREIKNPLAGLIKCAQCGRAMERYPYRQKNLEYLLCKTKGCCRMSALWRVEKRVLETLEAELAKLRPAVIQNERQNERNSRAVSSLREELRRTETQKERLYDFLEKGTYTIEVFENRMDKLKATQAAISREIERMQEEDRILSARAGIIIPRIERILQSYDRADNKEKNALLKSVLDKIFYLRLQGAGQNDFSIEIVLRDQ